MTTLVARCGGGSQSPSRWQRPHWGTDPCGGQVTIAWSELTAELNASRSVVPCDASAASVVTLVDARSRSAERSHGLVAPGSGATVDRGRGGCRPGIHLQPTGATT